MNERRIGDRYGRYVLRQKLGKGGMGVVYLAEDTEFYDRRVAVKFLHGHLAGNAEAVARFKQEARAAAMLGHPNIVVLFDFSTTEEGEAYYVMEFLEGQTLAERIDREGQMAVPVAADIAAQVCGALAKAHEHNIIHRDLKPANIFLTGGDAAKPIAKILDFGCAKLLDPATPGRLTQQGLLIGTPHYIAPEQISLVGDVPVDPRVDIYAMGVILYEMVCGRVPFAERQSPRDILSAQVNEDVPRPSSYALGLEPQIEKIVLGCLEPDPDRRIQTMRDLGAALAPFARSGGAGGTMILPAPGVDAGVPRTPPSTASSVASEIRRPRGRLPLKPVFVGLGSATAAGLLAWLVYDILGSRPPPPPPPPPARIEVLIDSNPSKADIFVSGSSKSLGKTPLRFQSDRSDEIRAFEVRKSGYRPQRVDVGLGEHANVRVILAPERPPGS